MTADLNFMYIIIAALAGVVLGVLLARLMTGGDKTAALLDENKNLREQTIRLETERLAFERTIKQHEQDLAAMEQKFSLQFENLANRIFDEKNTKFKQETQEGLTSLLSPLKEKIQEFQKKVDDSFGAQFKEHISLKKEIENIVLMNARMTVQTESLTKALKGDVKAQGTWGEVILEKILEEAGLQNGLHFTLQGADLNLKHIEDQGHLKPDVIIHLPENKHVIVDSKVSLTSYERYCAADTSAAQQAELLAYITSLKKHIDELSSKRYQDSVKMNTPDFVLLFVPIESAYALALQADTQLHSYAWQKKIAIVSPTTLFVTLKTVASLWRIENQNRHAEEIARQGGGLYDKIYGFVADMQKLGKQLDTTQATYAEALDKLSRGRGNILSRTENLKTLGAKTSKDLPKELLEDDTPVASTDVTQKIA